MPGSSSFNLDFFIKKFLPDYGSGNILAAFQQLYVIFLISVPLSLLLYLMFSRYRHKMVVDLGHHKWLVK